MMAVRLVIALAILIVGSLAETDHIHDEMYQDEQEQQADWNEDDLSTNPSEELVQMMTLQAVENAEAEIKDPPELDKAAVATELSKNIDSKVSPCEDFYQHACGNWIKTFKKPKDHATWTRSFDSISHRVKQISKSILEGKTAISEKDVPPVLVGKLQTFYKACNDNKAINNRGTTPVKEFLEKHIPKIHDVPSFMAVLASLGSKGLDKLFSFGISSDPKAPLTHLTSMGQGGLGLPDRSYYWKKEKKKMVKEQYLPLIEGTLNAVTLKGDTKAGNKQLAKDVLDFETKLAKITVDRTKLRDPVKTYHKFTKKQLYKLAPVLKYYFKARKENSRFWQLSPEIFTSVPAFFSGLSKLLSETPVKTLRGYLKWHISEGLLSTLSDEISYPFFKFFSMQLSGVKARTPRWERCYYAAGSHLRDIMGHAFVSVAFKGDSKTKANTMISMIKAAFGRNLQKLAWLDSKTRDLAKIKLDAMVDMIGYPSKWHAYEKAIISDDHLQNSLALDQVSNDFNLAKLGKPVDKTEWGMSPATVNAYNSLETNTIVFPAAILQPPFFSHKSPMAMNFGAIGVVMGHELSHGFDDEGHLYDKEGKLDSWWKPAVAKKFQKRVECVSNQYSQDKLPGLKGQPDQFVQGNLTLGEDLADNGGLVTALGAYRNWASNQPGGIAGQKFGKFTGDQVYFYSFAQSWCTQQAVKSERQQAATDPHAPSEFRVNGAVKNSVDFAAAFQCKPGTKMNPKKRCLVWAPEEKK
jgi:predicted metalloendopeptidase